MRKQCGTLIVSIAASCFALVTPALAAEPAPPAAPAAAPTAPVDAKAPAPAAEKPQTPAAASRLIVLPVLVGAGPEPQADLMNALVRGLQNNGPWTVIQGEGVKELFAAAAALPNHGAFAARLADAKSKLDSGASAEAVKELEAVRNELSEANRTLPFASIDHDLAYRTRGVLVAALLAANETERARIVAEETVLLFPQRKPTDADGLPASARTALGSASTAAGAKLTIKTNPEACEVSINGVPVGRAPVEVAALPGGAYQAQASCTPAAGGTALVSFPKRFSFGDKETARSELLDAAFEQTFRTEGGARLRFASSHERRQLEDSTARRVAERYGADAVVLASVGELSGAEWLNARLYLKSGYLNRQALVRLEPGRAAGLGVYLATGREVPGVLRPEEAGALVAAAQPSDSTPKGRAPWYTDAVGWTFTGLGIVGTSLGLWAAIEGKNTKDQADNLRPPDSARQEQLWRDAQQSKFLGSIGVIGGGLMAVTGVVLLLIPEYGAEQGDMFVIAPVRGGAAVGLSGRF